MVGMCCGQNHHFQHGWNVMWSKSPVSAWVELVAEMSVERVVVKIVSFSMSGMIFRRRMRNLKVS
jgi:hypothetical protein